jgi:hypothetical protein
MKREKMKTTMYIARYLCFNLMRTATLLKEVFLGILTNIILKENKSMNKARIIIK